MHTYLNIGASTVNGIKENLGITLNLLNFSRDDLLPVGTCTRKRIYTILGIAKVLTR